MEHMAAIDARGETEKKGAASEPIPEGSTGLPLLGETLAFAKDGYAFIAERLKKHGGVFRTRVLGRDTAVISGPASCETFLDADTIQRDGAMPPHIFSLFGGRSLPTLDGAEHKARKEIILSAFGRDALARYLPDVQSTIERHLARWGAQREVVVADAAQSLALEAICRNVMSIEDDAALDAIRRDYLIVAAGFNALPVKIPGGALSKALAARDRLFARFDVIIADHRKKKYDDGLARMLDAKASDGTKLDDEQIKLELHHVIVAGFVIFAELVGLVLHLGRNDDVRGKSRKEVLAVTPKGAFDPSALRKLEYVTRVVNEVKRLTPILPAIFAKAKRDFVFEGKTVPAGWMVLWALRSTNVDASTYTHAESFDPDRFSPERAEHEKHPHAFAPHGPGGELTHRCPGADYATIAMQIFTASMLRDWDWTLPPQRFELDTSRTPPLPIDGVRAKFTKRA
jgi:cytochrome P450